MNRRFVLSSLPLLLLVAVLAGISSLPRVHAPGYPNGPGEVCLNDASAVPAVPASPCPAAPYVFNGPFPSTPQVGPTQARVGVYVNGSAGTNAFDIILLTTPTILKPAGIDLSGSVMNTITGPASVVLECVGSALIHGSVCSANDTAGTIHLAVAAAPGAFVNPPVSGLLFTAIFNITGTAPAGGVSIGFQTQCGSATSVVSGACVTIASGGKNPDAETLQTAVFDNSGGNSQLTYFVVQSNVTSASLLQGATAGNHVLITVTAPNSLPVLGSASISLTFTASPAANALGQAFSPPVFTATSSPTAACSVFAGTPLVCTQAATIVTSVAGNYLVSMIGTYTGDNFGPTGPGTTTYSLLAPLAFGVTVTGAGWVRNGVIQSATSTDTNYYAKGPQSVVETFASLGGYSGTVTLTTSVCSAGTTGAVCPFGLPPAFNLGVGQIVTKLINFTATAPGRILYRNTMTATGLPTLTDGTDTIFIAGFGMVSNVTSLTFASGGHAGALATVTSQGTIAGTTDGRFVGSVAINSTVSPSGLKITCTPNSVTLLAGTSQTSSCSFAANVTSTTPFTASITGTGGVNNAMTNSTGTISVMVIAAGPPPGINLSASPTSVTTNVDPPGGTSTVTVASRGGFTGTGTATLTVSPATGCTLSPTSVPLPAGGTSTLTCTSAVAQNVVETVTATSGTTTNSTGVTFHFTDFSVTASLTSVTTTAGTAATSTITVAPLNSFSGTVTLAVTTNSTNLSCTLSSSSISGGSGTSTLSCTGSPAGNYLATVTGTSSSLSHSATVTYHVTAAPDFSVTANPTSVSVNTAVSGTSTVTVTPANGFTSTVTLAVTTNSTNVACTLSSTSITGGSGTSTLSCSASVAGNYVATVTGTSGSLSHSAMVIYHITPPPNFTVSASPTISTVNAGATGTSTITVAPLNGFTGTVTLAVTTNSTNLVCTLSSTSIVGGSGASTLSCHGSPAGNYLATVTGTSASLSHSATVTYHVQDFSVTANPTSVSVSTGTAGTSTITVAPLNGLTAAVTLSVTTNSTNLVCTLSSTSIGGASGTSTLSCTANISGNYLATVSGISGSLSHPVAVTYHVTAAADFSVTANPTSVNVNAGASGTSAITVAPLNGFTGTVALAVTTNSTNLVCALSSTSITGGSGGSTLSCQGSPAGNYLATVTGTSGALSHSSTVTFHVQDFASIASQISVSVSVNVAGTSTITVAPINGFSNTVTLAVTTNSTNLSCTLSSTSIAGGSGTSILSCSGSVAGNYLATVTGTSGTLSHSATVTFHVTAAADFSVTANPTTANVNSGATGTSTITIAPLNGFASTVTLAVTTNSTNLVCTLSSSSITGGSGSSTLSCHGSPTGNYQATVTGTSGSLSHSATVAFHVQDFSLTASTATVSTSVNVAGTSTISVASLNGFAGTVTLSVSTNSTNLACTLSLTSIAGGSGTSTLSCSSSVAANYLATVMGTSSSLSHSVAVTYHVTAAADFGMTASPTTVTVTVSTAGTSTITVASLNGFSGTVTLAVTTNSTSLSCTLSSTSITGGSGSSTLSCAGSPAGNYLATITGTSGTLSHSAQVTYHVTAAPDFSVSANPTSVNVAVGVAGTSTISVAPLNGFTSTVALVVTTNSTNLSCTLSATSISGGSGISTLSCTASISGNYLATVTGTSGTLSHSATVAYHITAAADFAIAANPTTVTVAIGTAGTSAISISPVNGFSGTVSLTVTTNSTNLSCALSSTSISGGSGSSTLSCTSSVAGNFLATVMGTSGTLSHFATVTYHTTALSDFTLKANPTSVPVTQGQAGTSAITVSPVNGFTGTVGLSVTTSSASLSCTLSTTSIIGGSGTSTLSCSSSATGNFTATVAGTGGSLSHSATVTFNVTAPPDFTISANPSSVTFTVGSSATVTINVASVNGFTGTVSLTAAVSPSGLTTTCSPTTMSLGVSGTSTCTLSSSIAGSFAVTVTGTSGTLSHSATISASVTQVTAGDFTITASRTLITLGLNTHTAYAVILRSNGFVGTVALTLTVTPTVANGVTATLKFSSLMLTLNGSNASNVMVFDTGSTPPGNYTITITGASGSLSHSATTTVTVSGARSVLLTFNGFELDDFDNGVGQFQVLVNGHLVADIPAGLNNLTGTGDFAPYVGTTVNFGPFDITALLVQGQNTVLFNDPTSFDHFGVVSSVRITQGDTVLLSMPRNRGIYPGHSVAYTFSNPPLVITSITGSTQTPSVDQGVTFTATYTGGTAPFRCVFRFGDGGSGEVLGSAGSCSAVHHYDYSGTFTVSVVIKGASTSDLVTGNIPVSVTNDHSFLVAAL